MASWKRHFKLVDKSARMNLYRGKEDNSYDPSGSSRNYRSFLPEIYAGFPNRLDRFQQYDQMENDPEIHSALDILADFCTQNDEDNEGNPFDLAFSDDTPETIIETVRDVLDSWVELNELDRRIFDIVRNCLKYGDYFFVRDPETQKLYPANPYKIEKIVVDESAGKQIEQYFIRDLELNLQAGVATSPIDTVNNYSSPGGVAAVSNAGNPGTSNAMASAQMGGSQSSRFANNPQSVAVDAEHVVHMSMNSGDDPVWPFGTSVLESIFKTYKQKELLEDAIIIYRIQRAPERRVFKIDVGNLPHHKAMQFVERMKNEMHQRRIPTRDGSGSNSFTLMDTAYNPLSIMEDFYLPVTADGRGSDISTLPGGECLALDTKIPLLDGRELTLAEMISEYNDGKQNWVYSCHPETGEIVPGKVTWAGETRKNAEVMKLKLDNGEEIICTPDHKFPIKGKGFVEAKDLQVNESMIPFRTEQKELGPKKRGYTRVYDIHKKKWIMVHRLVAEFMRSKNADSHFIFEKEGKLDTVHHLDFDRHNNNPENLTWMSFWDHKSYHQSIGFPKEVAELGSLAAKEKMEWLKTNDPVKYADIIDRRVEGRRKWFNGLTEEEKHELFEKQGESLRNYYANLSSEDRAKNAEKCRENGKAGWPVWQKMISENPELEQARAKKASAAMKTLFAEDPSRALAISERNYEMWQDPAHYDKVFKNQKIRFNRRLLEIFLEKAVTLLDVTYDSLLTACLESEEFVTIFEELNKNLNAPNIDEIKFNHVSQLLASFGMRISDVKLLEMKPDSKLHAKISEFSGLNKSSFGRKIGLSPKKVDKLVARLGYDSFDHMSADYLNRNHRIAEIEYLEERQDTGTLTIDGLHEFHDYHTFALSTGVFTKNSLGQIDDLRFWNNKLIRGLKIPSSYLPFGPDEGTATYNDGKIGQVLVQEIRFAKYCQRLQNNFSPVMDEEFKRYLMHLGYKINLSDFKLRFNKPMNFAEWTKIEMLNSTIGLFTQMADVPFISKRMAMQEFLQWDEEKIARNARMWREENPSKLTGLPGLVADDDLADGAPGLQSVGFGSMSEFGDESEMSGDDEFGDDEDFENDTGDMSPLGGDDIEPGEDEGADEDEI